MFRAGVRGHDALRELTSVIGILVESAALYSLTGIIYIAFYARGHPLASPLSNLFGAMTVRKVLNRKLVDVSFTIFTTVY